LVTNIYIDGFNLYYGALRPRIAGLIRKNFASFCCLKTLLRKSNISPRSCLRAPMTRINP
jgi:hypothetical protein